MSQITAAHRQEIEARHAHLLKSKPLQRLMPLIVVMATLLYGVYALWFFDIPRIVSEAQWFRMGLYLRQWVSYDVQPEFRLGKDGITIRYPRFSPLGDDPHPDWVVTKPDGSKFIPFGSGGVTIATTGTTIVARGATVHIDVTSGKPVIEGKPPAWVTVYDEDVLADLGFSGDVSLSADRVKVRKRFFGWANFVFDTSSPFFGKSASETLGLIFSDARLDPSQSNLSLALDNIWNNSAWQHGDVWVKLAQTVVMAFLGTLLGAVLAFPLAFMAARNITPNHFLGSCIKRFFDFLRSMDLLIWSLFLTRAFGPGPLAGAGAIFLTETGTLGKVYAEGLENIDKKPGEGIQSTGASTILTHRYATMPQVAPVMAGQTLYQWESNIRDAATIGAVGAGGIGLKLWEAMRTNSNWANVAYMVLLTLLVTFLFDVASSRLRQKLMGTDPRR
ncbi:phosphonate ABC transporter, permease protein PhnE [Rhizobium rhizosphaerae]|uniref:Phosphonate ABC transporter, permease protein PhnE n=1 Tax=Xaviernesmea rhizosphaerae TaxID=1672749 RepID=A0A1Q9APX1_9HYPH|nr:phosphonate ABC transporter, permease protein PhnE [Xaviernesmea rhizosphaerae]OLP57441.1 phosphonate ABC transporter, permease protein PhnE [Xaviernesmea rhizosphaerae]OQP84106.1 phosphonate ABC transporter, permease protein PhnE [Xaviernesmea rhizosphaerae]